MAFVPPPYPYDRLKELTEVASAHDGGAVLLSIGAPYDPPPPAVIAALATSDTERSYPASKGSVEFRSAAAGWLNRTAGLSGAGAIGADDVRATVGSKELVAGLPQILRLRRPDRDTVLYPAVSYPSYAMGAELAGCRAVPVAVDESWSMDLSTVDPADVARALCLWVDSPGNPTGGLSDLGAMAAWGRANDVLVVSDECYISFTWDGPPRSILEHGTDGVLAVHSLSKRSNLAGVRSGFYAGDRELVDYLGEVRQHAGLIQAGPVQAASIVAFEDESHVDDQRKRYWRRLELMQKVLAELGSEAPLPGGGFYLWAPAPDGDAWAFARHVAAEAGAVISPGEFYGEAGSGYVRVAAVQTDQQIELVAKRVGLNP